MCLRRVSSMSSGSSTAFRNSTGRTSSWRDHTRVHYLQAAGAGVQDRRLSNSVTDLTEAQCSVSSPRNAQEISTWTPGGRFSVLGSFDVSDFPNSGWDRRNVARVLAAGSGQGGPTARVGCSTTSRSSPERLYLPWTSAPDRCAERRVSGGPAECHRWAVSELPPRQKGPWYVWSGSCSIGWLPQGRVGCRRRRLRDVADLPGGTGGPGRCATLEVPAAALQVWPLRSRGPVRNYRGSSPLPQTQAASLGRWQTSGLCAVMNCSDEASGRVAKGIPYPVAHLPLSRSLASSGAGHPAHAFFEELQPIPGAGPPGGRRPLPLLPVTSRGHNLGKLALAYPGGSPGRGASRNGVLDSEG